MFPRLSITLLMLASMLAISHRSQAQKPPDTQLRTATYDLTGNFKDPRPEDQPNPKIGPVDPNAPIGQSTQKPTLAEMHAGYIKFICEVVDPPSWKPGHVPLGTVVIDGDKLVVSQTAENQRLIANLFKQLKPQYDGTEAAAQKLYHAFNETRLEKTKFDATPLAEAVQAIAKQVKIPIEVDWQSFRKAAILADSPVTVEFDKPTGSRSMRRIFSAAAGYTLPIYITTTAKTVKVSYDDIKPKAELSRLIDVSTLPARACGLDPKTPFTRVQALDALVARIKQEVPTIKDVHRARGDAPYIIVGGFAPDQLRVTEFMDEIDDQAIAQVEAGK
jgi:hypothetical protein